MIRRCDGTMVTDGTHENGHPLLASFAMHALLGNCVLKLLNRRINNEFTIKKTPTQAEPVLFPCPTG